MNVELGLTTKHSDREWTYPENLFIERLRLIAQNSTRWNTSLCPSPSLNPLPTSFNPKTPANGQRGASTLTRVGVKPKLHQFPSRRNQIRLVHRIIIVRVLQAASTTILQPVPHTAGCTTPSTAPRWPQSLTQNHSSIPVHTRA